MSESIAMKAAHKFCERFGEWKQQEVVECELAAIIEAEYANVEAAAEARGRERAAGECDRFLETLRARNNERSDGAWVAITRLARNIRALSLDDKKE